MLYRKLGIAKLYFAQSDSAIVDLLEMACHGVATMLGQRWGLLPPWEIRVFVAHSWLGAIRCEGPQGLLFSALRLLVFGVPPWVGWNDLAGFACLPARRPRVIIKTPAAVNPVWQDLDLYRPTIQHHLETVLCHELTHACTFRLDLPFWLNEGLALLAEDHFCGHSIWREARITTAQSVDGTPLPQSTFELLRQPSDERLHALFRCYRLVRYLDDTALCVLRRILSPTHPVNKHESAIARELGLPQDQVMHQLEERAVHYYRRNRGPTVRGSRKVR